MIYCISDIHGEMDRFQAMLDVIQLSNRDKLYILGDAIDRAPLGVDVLQLIMHTPNMHMLLGNHEQMCFATLGARNICGAKDLWMSNGGSPTYRELMYHRSAAERMEILKFIAGLQDHIDIQVNKQKFHLVHGMVGKNTDERIWNRPDSEAARPFKNKTVIIGHTPTVYLQKQEDNEPFRIWHGDGIIDIDCGCGNQTPRRRLACIRLDDMAEFYV